MLFLFPGQFGFLLVSGVQFILLSLFEPFGWVLKGGFIIFIRNGNVAKKSVMGFLLKNICKGGWCRVIVANCWVTICGSV